MIPAALRFVRCEPWPSSSFALPALQAHRGHWQAGFQENTLPAFRAARAAGYKMAELDTRISKDGQAVVFHDEDLLRLGSRGQRTRETLAADLKRWAQAPTLREVLLDSKGVDFYNIEIKAPMPEAGKIEPVVARVIREARAEERVMISSFNPFTLALMAELLPRVPRALLTSDQREPGNLLPLRRMWLAPFLKIHMLNLDERSLTPEMVSELRARRLPFAVWTVNDLGRARQWLEVGARSVITDRVLPPEIGESGR